VTCGAARRGAAKPPHGSPARASRCGAVSADTPLEVLAPATGARLGTVAPVDLAAAVAAAKTAQPLWSLVPVSSRARYIRRTAVAMLDELDALALRLADETGWPRTHIVLSELLPAVRGLHALAADGPRALADQRLSPRLARFAGRSTRLIQSPVGVIGLRGPSASPWAEPALEAAAALLAGNGVILAAGAPLAAQRLRAVFLRAGVPGELITMLPEPGGPELEELCRRVVDLPRPARRGTFVVLEGAPKAQVVEAALWAAFAGSGRHPAAAGRLVVVEGAVPGLVEALTAGAAALRIGDPRDEDTDVGPLARPEDAYDATLSIAGLAGTFAAPVVLAGLSAEDPRFVTPPPGPVLAVVEVADADTAVAVAARDGRDGPISVWARDADKGERVARRLPSVTTWVGRHGIAPTGVPVRLARHVVPRQLEWRAAWAPGTPSLPADDAFVAAQTALVEIRHGRESRRWPAIRAGAGALLRRRMR
jgi:acyl-CoA reductase-like NAD-dependent aldehyde dehydrogenase